MRQFSDWLKLQEVGTGTNSIAQFVRPIFSAPLRTRKFLGPWGDDDPFFRKNKQENLGAIKDVLAKKFSDWIRGRQRLDEIQAVAPVGQPQQGQPSVGQPQQGQPQQGQPQQGQPSVPTPNQQQNTQPLATVSVNPSNYRGQNKAAYQRVYQQFLSNKNPQLGSALYSAINGNDSEMMSIGANPTMATRNQ